MKRLILLAILLPLLVTADILTNENFEKIGIIEMTSDLMIVVGVQRNYLWGPFTIPVLYISDQDINLQDGTCRRTLILAPREVRELAELLEYAATLSEEENDGHRG